MSNPSNPIALSPPKVRKIHHCIDETAHINLLANKNLILKNLTLILLQLLMIPTLCLPCLRRNTHPQLLKKQEEMSQERN